MKGKNFLIGAAVYGAIIFALYNRRKTAYTGKETKAQVWYATRKAMGSKPQAQDIARVRAAALQKVVSDPKYELDDAYTKAYLEQKWVR